MSDSSDVEVHKKKSHSKDKKKHAKPAVAQAADPEEFVIKPEKGAPSVDTSNWPLLLKVFILS